MVNDMNKALLKDLRRALRTHKYERSTGGILLPAAQMLIGGVFGCRVDDGPLQAGHNTIANEFIDLLLNVVLGNASAPSAWYIAPFTSSTAPTNALTGATFTATQTEYTAYTESTRQQWVKDAASTAEVMQNANAPAVFTIGTGGATITGAGMLSASAKSATSNTLAAAGLFSAANTLGAGSKLTVEYGISGTAT